MLFRSRTFAKPLPKSYPAEIRHFGDHVRRRRIELAMIQEDVARLLETSTDTITNWENGRGTPQIKFYPRIVKFLGYNPFALASSAFGEVLHSWRSINGVSSKELAKRLGVHTTTVQEWENGKRVPHRKVKERVLELTEKTKPPE